MKESTLKRFVMLSAIVLLVAAVAGCSSAGNETSSKVEAYGDQETNSTIESVAQNAAKAVSEDAPEITTTTKPAVKGSAKVAGKQYAIIETNKGTIRFEFYPEKAPKTVANFMKLASSGYYNGIKWHRVVPGFVIQGGDPLSKDEDPNNDGTGGPGYTIPAEFNEKPHLQCTVAMARSADPNSGGSQFYICLEPQPNLDGQYTVFGQVVDGMDVVQSIQVGDTMDKVYIEK